MINVTVSEQKTQNQKPFPKLMESDDIIVLFSIRNDTYKLGYYCDEWDTEEFSDFNEPITLQNA
jgi:hypothetical protein